MRILIAVTKILKGYLALERKALLSGLLMSKVHHHQAPRLQIQLSGCFINQLKTMEQRSSRKTSESPFLL
jgi:hypothetical protein